MIVIRVDPVNPERGKIARAAEIIKKGGLVAFPTETVYGLGGDALNENAVRRIFEAKERPPRNPLIVHVSSVEQVYRIAEVNEVAEKLMGEFFPGPLALVLKKKDVVPDITTAGMKKVAVRMPDHKVALTLIELSETPIAAPSANISGRPSPTKAEHVIEDLAGRIDAILDAGEVKIGIESTVLDVTSKPAKILRLGAITPEMLVERGIEVEVIDTRPFRHYQTKAKLYVVNAENLAEFVGSLREKGVKVGVARITAECDADRIVELGKSIEDVAKNLFSALRELDRSGVDIIVVEAVERKGLGKVIMSKLEEAGEIV
ncbi:L-threonylcarbamoyladenylate synthase [Archaeoglobus veneficus]|uniref:Threonylcarbamoyl-AMP synthase n=1 Tax=Archaeoglobus veneficus (strain DSM 11195 / SNP6) TaxID=693661 RepID=F2KMZ1_ARCVS|nr:L-threonylcarbamoyladenylate synthase [Archaeoglobus veneficus]AEA47267.1 Sua5/YciO/YrdC/YwlC family protein [Archaeoglobus veneficus SNP6]